MEPLPAIPVPLLPGDADVSLDLQAIFAAAYESANYDLVLNYREPPEARLDSTEATLMARVLTPFRTGKEDR